MNSETRRILIQNAANAEKLSLGGVALNLDELRDLLADSEHAEQFQKELSQYKEIAAKQMEQITKHCTPTAALVDKIDELQSEIEQLRKDKKRQDWLEKNGELQHLYEEGRPNETVPCIIVRAWTFDFDDDTIRATIDAAIAKEDAR